MVFGTSLSRSDSGRRPLQETNPNFHDDETKSSRRHWWPLKTFTSVRNEQETRRVHIPEHPQAKYTVLISAVPGCSFESILSQIYGGPLRSVHCIQLAPFPVVLLEFISSAHAAVCRNYVQRQKCVVNGIPVRQCKPSESHYALLRPRAPLPEGVTQISRRTLEIFRPVCVVSSTSLCLLGSEVGPPYILKVFNRIGNVIQVRPMVYQKHIAFAIDFDDVHTAVKAKRLFDEEVFLTRHVPQKTQDAHKFPGLHQWSLEFSRDSTERNICF